MIEIVKGNLSKTRDAKAEGYSLYCPRCRIIYKSYQKCDGCGSSNLQPVEKLEEDLESELARLTQAR